MKYPGSWRSASSRMEDRVHHGQKHNQSAEICLFFLQNKVRLSCHWNIVSTISYTKNLAINSTATFHESSDSIWLIAMCARGKESVQIFIRNMKNSVTKIISEYICLALCAHLSLCFFIFFPLCEKMTCFLIFRML